MSRCGLCLQDRVLKKSHLMPKSLYRVTMNFSPEPAKDLMQVSMKEGRRWYANKQFKTPFLCGTCEDLFSKEGETTVCGECYRGDGKFILRDEVKKASAISTEGDKRWINPIKGTTDINSDAYLYFGASVIWRSSAGKWPDSIGKRRGSLGETYQEELRRFLLGETGFPSKIYLLVSVDGDGDEDILPVMILPAHGKSLGHHYHDFCIPGIRFLFFFGSVRAFKELKTQVLFVERSFSKSKYLQTLVFDLTETKPRGRLADEADPPTLN